MQEYLNISGNPGEVFRLDCLHDEIVVLKCCLSTEIAKTERKIQSGIKCPNDVIENLRYRQLLLNKLTCIDFDNLDKECLSEEQISQIILYLKNKCKNCKIWADDVVKCTEPEIPCYSCGGDDGGNGSGGGNECQLTTGIIQNPSFETYTTCPDFRGQIAKAYPWVNPVGTTVDYFNQICNFEFPEAPSYITDALPHGTGYVAIFAGNGLINPSTSWKEYIAQCLAQSLTSGKKYKLTISIAAAAMSINGSSSTPPVCDSLHFGNINMTLYGTTSCNHITASTSNSACPTDNVNWVILGQTIYTPSKGWTDLSIEFTPQATIAAIAFGPPCTLPSDYKQSDGGCWPWFFLDNIRLCQYV